MRRAAGQVPAHVPAAVQLAVLTLVGVVGGAGAGMLLRPALAPLVGWDAAALAWLAVQWGRLPRLDADGTARLATLDDPGRAMRDTLLLAACLGSLLAVGLVLTTANEVPSGPVRDVYVGLGVLSVVLSWFVVHTVFATRYARLYYRGEPGGIDFHQNEPPDFVDFAYMSFTVGATFQISDTDVGDRAIRRTVFRHTLLSYLLGAVIVATTVNLLANLGR